MLKFLLKFLIILFSTLPLFILSIYALWFNIYVVKYTGRDITGDEIKNVFKNNRLMYIMLLNKNTVLFNNLMTFK